jgi:hypothetical protein
VNLPPDTLAVESPLLAPSELLLELLDDPAVNASLGTLQFGFGGKPEDEDAPTTTAGIRLSRIWQAQLFDHTLLRPPAKLKTETITSRHDLPDLPHCRFSLTFR